MATHSHVLIGTMVITAAMIIALPVAKAIDAATLPPAPSVNVNRAAKGDQLAARRPKQKPQIMDGCDPLFSPVAVPQMAHVTGRCVG